MLSSPHSSAGRRERFCIAIAAVALFVAVAGAANAARPNVVLIAVDDLNAWAGHLGTHPGAQTPNIDRLAQRGITFTHAYAPAPACNPSRAAILTGRRPSTTGVYENDQPWQPILGGTVSLPQLFMRNGYHVIGGGKIFHGQAGRDGAYWNEYFDRPEEPGPPSATPRNLPAGLFEWGPLDVSADQMADYRLATWAIGELRSTPEPFFLAVGFRKPHPPWYVPRAYYDRFPIATVELPVVKDDDLVDIPAAGVKMADPGGDHAALLRANQWRAAVQGYLAALAFVDEQVGRILAALDASPRRDRTIVVLWGDNGWHFGEKQHWRKFALWEEATRTTFIIDAPGVTRQGRCDHAVDLLSLYPTLVDLAGLPSPGALDGHSLRPLLQDPAAAWPWPALTTHGRGNHAVRTDTFRYIRYRDGAEELYDHRTDPHEWTNLSGDPATAALRAELRRYLPTTEAPDAPRRISDW